MVIRFSQSKVVLLSMPLNIEKSGERDLERPFEIRNCRLQTLSVAKNIKSVV